MFIILAGEDGCRDKIKNDVACATIVVATRLLTASRKVCWRAGYRTSSLTKVDRKMWIGIKTKKILHYKGSACQWFWSDCGSFDLIVIFDMVFITKPKVCFKSYPTLVCCISKWVSDCSLTPSELCFSHIMARTSYISMSEWLLFNAKWAMFQPYQGKNKLHFDEMISALYETNTLI